MVPFNQMQQLHKAVRTPHCTWVEFDYAYHMDAYLREADKYWAALSKFLRQHVNSSSTGSAAAAR